MFYQAFLIYLNDPDGVITGTFFLSHFLISASDVCRIISTSFLCLQECNQSSKLIDLGCWTSMQLLKYETSLSKQFSMMQNYRVTFSIDRNATLLTGHSGSPENPGIP